MQSAAAWACFTSGLDLRGVTSRCTCNYPGIGRDYRPERGADLLVLQNLLTQKSSGLRDHLADLIDCEWYCACLACRIRHGANSPFCLLRRHFRHTLEGGSRRQEALRGWLSWQPGLWWHAKLGRRALAVLRSCEPIRFCRARIAWRAGLSVRRLLPVEVYVHLRERNTEVGSIQGLFRRAYDCLMHVPEIGGFGPHAQLPVDRAVS